LKGKVQALRAKQHPAQATPAIAIIVAVAALLAWSTGDVRAQQTSQRVFVDRGACEGEACGYGIWKTHEPTAAYARADARSPIVRRLRAGECVTAETGEVRVVPGRFRVTRAHDDYHPGEVLGVYTYVGEDVFKVWHRGRWKEAGVSYSPPGVGDVEKCELEPNCWGVFEVRPVSVTWAKLRDAAGRVAWTNQPGNFIDPYWLSESDCRELRRVPPRRTRRRLK